MKKLTLELVNYRISNRGIICTEYNGALTKSRFVCSEGHEWYALPSNVFAGNNCPTCAGIKRYTLDDVQKELSIKGFRCIDYGGTTHSNSTFECSNGHSWVTWYSHLQKGGGCPWCSQMYPYDLERLNNEIASKNIQCIDYCGNVKQKSKFKCACGCEWSTRATNVLNKTGCPSCSKSGYDPYRIGFLYLLCAHDSSVLKIGITNNEKDRIKTLRNKTPFSFNVLECVRFENGNNPPALERHILKTYENAGLSGFDGATEWLKWDYRIIEELSNVKN